MRTPGGVVNCFLDKTRACDKTCKAFNERSEDCKFLERSALVSRSFKLLMHWLGQNDAPSIKT
jgi:hypothetical protein